MAASQRNLSFRVDQGSGRTVITVVDATTKEVIRQIPSEDVLAMSRALEASERVARCSRLSVACILLMACRRQ